MLEILAAVCTLLCPADHAEIVFAGDAMQHQRQIDAALCSDGSLDYSSYFRDVAPYVSSADFAVVNLETPLGGAPYSGYPMFCAHDNYLTALTGAGFDLMLSANNHILDRSDRGVLRTIDTFESRGVAWTGVYRNREHRDSVCPVIRDIAGFKVAFLNYTYGTNGIEKRSDIEIDYIDRGLMASDVRKAREKGAELIAACVHWGDEYHLLPNSSQKSLAAFLDSLGVEMIIGGHPHVIQPMELLHSPHSGNPVLKVFSLGNFISGMLTSDTRGGAMVRVTLGRDFMRRPVIRKACYSMVFVEPPVGRDDNYKLRHPDSDRLHASVRHHRDAFVRNARGIFDRHNRNVFYDDTLF